MCEPSFRERVYLIVKKIPPGRVTSYLAIAKKLRSSPRAIAQALKANKHSYLDQVGKKEQVPCHRIVMQSASIGGFNKGVSAKIRLLKEEGVKVRNNKVEDFDKLFYKFDNK